MKPERIQFRAFLVERARSFASWVRNLLDWVQNVAAALGRLFGSGNDEK